MPYDPRQMQQISRMGIGMMAPEPSPFQQPQQQPRRSPEWWEQPLATPRKDQPADQTADPSQDPDAPKRPQPSLLQMLMLGGKPTYSGTPRPGPTSDPWGWLGSVGSRPPR
jgi:hypothetical protein